MAPFKFIVWDWNGTLLHDVDLCLDIINQLLHKYSKSTIDLQTYQQHFTFPVETYYQNIGFDFGETPFQQVGSEWMEAYSQRWRECNLQSDAQQVLTAIRQGNINQAIISAMDINLLRTSAQFYNVLNFFLALRGLDHHYADGKMEIAEKFVRSFELDASKILFVGDTTHDYEVAQAVGAECVLFYSGHHSKKKLKACKAPVVETLTDVLNFIPLT